MNNDQNKEQHKIAVFIDAENISAKYVKRILTNLENRGQILFLAAYADWSLPNHVKNWEATPINTIDCLHNNKEKQVVDKKIREDAEEMARQHPEIDCFCIVASDKGYSGLARLLRRKYGKFVLGIGEKKQQIDY